RHTRFSRDWSSDVCSSDLRRTSLYDEHVAAGARLVPFAGWEMPIQYEGIAAEHAAVRERAGMFDVSHMGQIRTSGPEAAAFLQQDRKSVGEGKRGEAGVTR